MKRRCCNNGFDYFAVGIFFNISSDWYLYNMQAAEMDAFAEIRGDFPLDCERFAFLYGITSGLFTFGAYVRKTDHIFIS